VEVNIVNEVAALQRLSVGQLRQRFAELFGRGRLEAALLGDPAAASQFLHHRQQRLMLQVQGKDSAHALSLVSRIRRAIPQE
jgi:hypothetical protein